MEELLDKAEAKARKIVADRDISEDDVKKIALGAVKFSDFTADRRTIILCAWDSIFAVTGFSGPYSQDAAVRVNKILQDNGIQEEVSIGDYSYDDEKAVIVKLLDYPDVVRLAARDIEPHKVATYLYELAREMNRYYETTRVSDAVAQEKAARIQLLEKISHVFTH